MILFMGSSETIKGDKNQHRGWFGDVINHLGGRRKNSVQYLEVSIC
jgi:hypothetical protein